MSEFTIRRFRNGVAMYGADGIGCGELTALLRYYSEDCGWDYCALDIATHLGAVMACGSHESLAARAAAHGSEVRA